MRLANSIIKPIVTEKSVSKTADGWYTFKVTMNASKGLIAKELKETYNVDVIDAKTMILPGKVRRILKTRKYKKTPSWKKMVVKLKKGQKLDLFPIE